MTAIANGPDVTPLRASSARAGSLGRCSHVRMIGGGATRKEEVNLF